MAKAVAAVIALVCGAALAWQVGANNALRQRTRDPLVAALISFASGTAVLTIALALARPAAPESQALRQAPWWAWTGGALGVVYVASAAAFAGRLGSAPWVSLVVTGQILASLVLDHYGLVGFARHPMNAWRGLGALLLIVGVVLVLRS